MIYDILYLATILFKPGYSKMNWCKNMMLENATVDKNLGISTKF